MPLNPMQIKNARSTEKQYKLSDGGGLYLLIHQNGGKYWQMGYRFGGKQKTFSIGTYPEISLAQAREKREEARKLLAIDQDPGEAKKKKKKEAVKVEKNKFKTIALEFHKIKAPGWTERHGQYWLHYMEKLVFPKFGEKKIDTIEPLEILEILRDLEKKKTFETRDRVAQNIGAVFKYAIATGRAKYNVADLRVALAERPKTKNFGCITHDEIPAFLRAVTGYEEKGKVSIITITAFRLLMLTATRTSEVRYSKWTDFDFTEGIWTVPAEQKGRKGKTGKRKDHVIPLATQAVALMNELKQVTGENEFVFPNRLKNDGVISENTILKVIESIGYKGCMTGHGFRSLARSVLGERGHRWEVLEAMLSHSIPSQTAAAYIRTTYFEERRRVMQEWADFLDAQEISGTPVDTI